MGDAVFEGGGGWGEDTGSVDETGTDWSSEAGSVSVVEMDIALIVWTCGGGSATGGLGEGDSSAADAGSLAGTEIDRTCSIKMGRN